ncbi:membrane-associated guanylate kinase, WW and PDZ domain-containing protein 3-like isoform X1 [Lates japonicus]|uniref:Membrane-associated guanylate kinase, WW and PDZ domain-containing protein 3-like isoform X1 n=1 Tax=Lates japonicus TaxID=270547 RepID=A0AAD3MA68_LATJO|nr:membrane-associated guanylate kinase, WW and PDZ domain-containing protein 3-like isoform X1 [Lates japonicus]
MYFVPDASFPDSLYDGRVSSLSILCLPLYLELSPSLHPKISVPDEISLGTGICSPPGKDWRYKEEDAAYRQERGAAESGDKSWGTSERHKKGKRAEQEAAAQKSHSHRERAGSNADSGTLSRGSGREKGDREYYESKYHGPAEEVNRKDPRGSSSSIQDPSCNGTTTSKKAPITPGPWKVPSSAKIQSQVDTTYADI